MAGKSMKRKASLKTELTSQTAGITLAVGK
jgi:hypothetical protein